MAVITADTEAGRHILRHSTAHVLAQAVTDLWPGAHYAIGPPIEDGFYYDFELPGGQHFSEDDLSRIEARMRAIVAEDQPFTREEHTVAEGLELFAHQPYKVEIIEAVDPADAEEGVAGGGGGVSAYRNTDRFVDLCRGPHVPSTGRLGPFKLTKVAAAYWRGDERRPQLQRIYGTAWESKAALDEHLQRLEEAERRDHRRLGAELDLFHFPPEIGGGLPVFHPKGGLIRKLMEDYSRAEHEKAGYQFVWTPAPGQVDPLRDLRPPRLVLGGDVPADGDGGRHLLPEAHELPDAHPDLPVPPAVLSGAADPAVRVRDGLPLRAVRRAQRTPAGPGHHSGRRPHLLHAANSSDPSSPTSWRSCCGSCGRSGSRSSRPSWPPGPTSSWAIRRSGTSPPRPSARRSKRPEIPYVVAEGEGAFYAPKIDVHVRDAIGRRWQVSTLQVDFQMPHRFGLEYVGADNQRHPPHMIHRALFGSIERFFGILIEHYAGALPAWLAPVQARVLPVRDDHEPYADTVAATLRAAGIRVDVVAADEPLGARVRKAKLEKLPYVLVVGDDDVAAGTVGVNSRVKERPDRGVPLADFIAGLRAEIETHALSPAET